MLLYAMSIKVCEPRAIMSSLLITPSPVWDKGNGPETGPGLNPQVGISDLLPALKGEGFI